MTDVDTIRARWAAVQVGDWTRWTAADLTRVCRQSTATLTAVLHAPDDVRTLLHEMGRAGRRRDPSDQGPRRRDPGGGVVTARAPRDAPMTGGAWPYTLVQTGRVLHVCEYPADHPDGVERAACGREGPIRTVPRHLTLYGRLQVCGACSRSSASARRLTAAIRAQETAWRRVVHGG